MCLVAERSLSVKASESIPYVGMGMGVLSLQMIQMLRKNYVYTQR